jgi:hypothetical protein
MIILCFDILLLTDFTGAYHRTAHTHTHTMKVASHLNFVKIVKVNSKLKFNLNNLH